MWRSRVRGSCGFRLYIAEFSRAGQSMLGTVAGTPVLTVGHDDRFLASGGMVRVRFAEARLRFDIDVGRTERVRLRISSKVLTLARIVRDGVAITP